MLRLLLIRHGVTEWNDTGKLMGRMPIGLAPHGRAQIERLAESLAAVQIDAIFSSPQRRTQETAEIIAAGRSLEVETDDGLDEVWAAPEWQGRSYSELRDHPDLIALLADAEHVSAFIEPAKAVQQRVVEAVERLCAGRSEGVIALVSHGDPLRMLLAHVLGIRLSHYRRLLVNTGSLSVVDRHRDRSQLMLLGWKPAGSLEVALSASAA